MLSRDNYWAWFPANHKVGWAEIECKLAIARASGFLLSIQPGVIEGC